MIINGIDYLTMYTTMYYFLMEKDATVIQQRRNTIKPPCICQFKQRSSKDDDPAV